MLGRWLPRASWQGGLCRALLVVLLAAMAPAAGLAQQAPVAGLPVLSLDQEQFFVQSKFGAAALAANKAASEALAAEFARISSELAAEERDLTERRATLPAVEFSALALEFDKKVEAIRAAQTIRPAVLQKTLEDEKLRFDAAARPVLAVLMAERGAFAIIDKRAVVLGFEAIDLTPLAIQRIDTVLGDGKTPQAPAP